MPTVSDELVIGDEVPTPFVAVTAKVYVVPLVNPVTSHVNAVVVVHVKLPGVDVTV
jgi:hypothetical protein